MHFVTYNIQYGKGQDGQVNLERIANEVRGADIIALQEVDRYWHHTGMQDQVKVLSENLIDYYWIYGPGVDLHVEDSAPSENKRRQFGNMLLSKFPILRSRHHLLPKRGSVDALSIQRSAIEATIDCHDTRLRIYSIHLTHLASETRIPQLEKLLHIHKNAIHEGAPMCGDMEGKHYEAGISDQVVPAEAVMMGDFNFQPGSPEYHAVVGPVSDYGGLISATDGFVDAWTQAGNDRNQGHTSDIDDQSATLDYCFVSTTLRHRIKGCRVDISATGSDHFPLWIEIDL